MRHRNLLVMGFAVVVSVGIFFLREATMSFPEPVPEDSALEITVAADTLVDDDPVRDLTRSQVTFCVAEAVPDSDVTSFEQLPGLQPDLNLPRFRFGIEPGADKPDRAQLTGCLEDVRVRHLRLDVRRLTMTVRDEVIIDEGEDVRP